MAPFTISLMALTALCPAMTGETGTSELSPASIYVSSDAVAEVVYDSNKRSFEAVRVIGARQGGLQSIDPTTALEVEVQTEIEDFRAAPYLICGIYYNSELSEWRTTPRSCKVFANAHLLEEKIKQYQSLYSRLEQLDFVEEPSQMPTVIDVPIPMPAISSGENPIAVKVEE